MPILKHAKKKLLVDEKRAEQNKKIKTVVRNIMKKFRAEPNEKNLSEVFSALDRAAKKHVFAKGKADRLKSRLSAKIAVKEVTTEAKKTVKKATKAAKSTVKKVTKKVSKK